MPTVIPPVMPMQVLPTLPMGKAAALLQLLEVPKANFIITDRCNLACAHCFAPRGVGELSHALIMRTVDELQGLPNVYFSGGEPFQHSAGQQAFLSLLHYTAARVGRVNIATNGAFVPENESDARSLLAEFPPNTTFMLSADDFHAAALAKTGRSLEQISRTLFDVTRSMGLGLEMFVREGVGAGLRHVASLIGADVPDDIFRHLFRNELIHGNSVLRQNSAMSLSPEDATPLSVYDFVNHSKKLSKLGIFVMQDGAVTDNSHAAYMKARPPFTILGNLNDAPLYDILRTRLLPGHFESGALRNDSQLAVGSKVRAASGDLFTKEELAEIVESALSPSRPIKSSEVREAVMDPNSDASWVIYGDFNMLYELMERNDFRRLFKETMANYIDHMCTPNDGSRGGPAFRYIIERGEARLDWSWSGYLERWSPRDMFLRELQPMLSMLEQEEGFDPAIIREDFLRPLCDMILKNINLLITIPNGRFMLKLLLHAQEALGTSDRPWHEHVNAWLGDTIV